MRGNCLKTVLLLLELAFRVVGLVLLSALNAFHAEPVFDHISVISYVRLYSVIIMGIAALISFKELCSSLSLSYFMADLLPLS